VAETGNDDLDGLAGEYVLGTLGDDERRAAEARLAADPAFRAAVAAWEARLQPLADSLPAMPPPARVRDRVMAAIGEAPAAAAVAGNVVSLHRSVRRWRIATAAAGLAAAVLAGIVVVDRLRPVPQAEFVAVLTAEGASPAFVATVDVAKGTMSLRQVAGEPAPADRSYELWAIVPNAPPRSLGLVEEASLKRALSEKPSEALTFAITLEQKGGSPDGTPKGPVVFKGSLVPTGE
jgi:anti-sigma-K factor RskA